MIKIVIILMLFIRNILCISVEDYWVFILQLNRGSKTSKRLVCYRADRLLPFSKDFNNTRRELDSMSEVIILPLMSTRISVLTASCSSSQMHHDFLTYLSVCVNICLINCTHSFPYMSTASVFTIWLNSSSLTYWVRCLVRLKSASRSFPFYRDHEPSQQLQSRNSATGNRKRFAAAMTSLDGARYKEPKFLISRD